MRHIMRIVEAMEASRPDRAPAFEIAMRNAHHGQADLTLLARHGGRVVGTLDFVEYDGEVSIQMISAHQRRVGVGTAMVRHLQAQYPDQEISWGSTTADGERLRRSLATDARIDPELQAKFDRWAEVKRMLATLQARADAYWAEPTEAKRQELMADGGAWNDLHDEERSLEQERAGRSPVTRIIR